MLPRKVTLLLVAIWLALLGWLVYHEVWPDLEPHQPPPWVNDLVQETKQNVTINYTFVRLGNETERLRHRQLAEMAGALGFLPGRTLRARFRPELSDVKDKWEYARLDLIEYNRSDDSFYYYNRLLPPKNTEAFRPSSYLGLTADASSNPEEKRPSLSYYHITRDGTLLDLALDLRYEKHGKGSDVEKIRVQFTGQPRAGSFAPHLRVTRDDVVIRDETSAALPVSRRGTVLNPLFPQHRIAVQEEGASWQVPVIDPLGLHAPVVLHAAVVGTELKTWGPSDRKDWCRKIEYHADGVDWLTFQSWVSIRDGVLLHQDVQLNGERFQIDAINP